MQLGTKRATLCINVNALCWACRYKSSMTSRRHSWRIIKKLEQRLSQSGALQSAAGETNHVNSVSSFSVKQESTDSSDDSRRNLNCVLNSQDLSEVEIKALAHFREAVKFEIESICYELIDLLRRHLLVHASETRNNEAQVFYLKLVGDYYRYLTEMSPSDRESEALDQANAYYNQALPLAYRCLKPPDPCRLSLVLNLSVFLFEILNKPDQACQLAKRGYDAAIGEVDGLPEKEQKESKLIMDLLRENLRLWTSIDDDD